MYTIRKLFRFEMAHQLSKAFSTACSEQIHGHSYVCEVFFAKEALLVEGDSEVAIFRYSNEVLENLGIKDISVNNTTIVSCGGKWTLIPIARLLKEFKIPFKIIHDLDRKGLSDKELAEKPAIHPYKANTRIENPS